MKVSLTNLTVRLGGLVVLDDITAASPTEAGVTAVVGPNAAGKTTLLRTIIGALVPAAGRVEVDGHDPHRWRGRAASLAYVAQRPSVSAAFTVREVVELGRYALSPDPRRVDWVLDQLELRDVADRVYPALSVGQQQRVAVARAVAQLEPPGVLVLDEPTSAMDLRHAAACHDLLRRLAGEGVQVLVALHDLTRAAAAAGHVWLLDRGRLVADGPAEAVMTPETLGRVFDVPFAWTTTPDGERWLMAPPSGRR